MLIEISEKFFLPESHKNIILYVFIQFVYFLYFDF